MLLDSISPAMFDSKKLWEEVLAQIELNVSKASFITWFKDTEIHKLEDGIVYVAVPSMFVRDWLKDKHHKLLLRLMREAQDGVRAIEYIVSRDEAKKKQAEPVNLRPAPQVVGELPLAEHYINREDNLNPRYTFESFVVGPFNELAYAASQAVIKKPGIAYNPLFVHGGTGHGKTHLIQAIGNHLKNNNGKKVYYIASEKFAWDYVNSMQSNKIGQFKEKYRKYDVLIMDDIQFLSSKEKSQEELFHLFNVLYDNNKQIIFSSDKHPNFIPNLEERLKSRFAAGMIIDIPAPDLESRAAIIRKKAGMINLPLQEETIDCLAEGLESNVRELEGILNLLLCQTQLKNRELGLVEVKNLLKNNQKPKKTILVKDLIKIIADFYNIDEMSIYEKTRKKEVVKPRQLTMYILREDFSISYPSIGQKLGGRDHTTVIHSCEKIKKDLKTDSVLAQEINQIRTMI